MRVIDLLRTKVFFKCFNCFKSKNEKSPYLIVKKCQGTRICRHQPLKASVETSWRKIKTKSPWKPVHLGSRVSSPSPDSAHLEGMSGNLRPCPLKQLTAQQGWLDLTARKTQKQSDSIRAALPAVSTTPQGSRLLPRVSRDPRQGLNHGGLHGAQTCSCSSDAWTVKEGAAASAPSSSSGEHHHCFTPWRGKLPKAEP